MASFFSPYDQLCLDQRCGLHVVDWAHGDGPLDVAVMGHVEDRVEGFVAAIGNFDGVHLGHAKVIHAAVAYAEAEGMTPAVITFAPHPRRFFAPDSDGFALADEEDKLSFLARLGVRVVIRLAFNDALRATSAEDFVSGVLADMNIKHLFAGSDFAFGKERGGGMDMIAEMGADQGLVAHVIDLQANAEDVISSSSIRKAIGEGDMASATHLLGRPYIISGDVIEGDRHGRSIGFPTANMRLDVMQQPAYGVYTIAARLPHQDGKIFSGVANLGIRPTVADRGVLLEAHLFDYDGDLYGQRINVFLLDFIRPERAFDGFDELKEQIAIDAATARQYHQDDTRNV